MCLCMYLKIVRDLYWEETEHRGWKMNKDELMGIKNIIGMKVSMGKKGV